MRRDFNGKEHSDFGLDKEKIGNRYFWLKLPLNFFDTEDIRVILGQENGEKYVIFFIRLLSLAVKQEEIGILRFKENIPYTTELLSTVTNTDIDVVRSALMLFKEFGMIDINDDGDILLESAIKMVGSECDSAQRGRKFRAKHKDQKKHR